MSYSKVLEDASEIGGHYSLCVFSKFLPLVYLETMLAHQKYAQSRLLW